MVPLPQDLICALAHIEYMYLLLQDLACTLDEVIVLAIGVIMFSQRRLQERGGAGSS